MIKKSHVSEATYDRYFYCIAVNFNDANTYIHTFYLPQATWPINTQDMQIDRKTDIIK